MENIFTNLTSDRGLISKIYKELHKVATKTPNKSEKDKHGMYSLIYGYWT